MRFGPQPYEAAISEICASFGCPPSVAIEQPWPLTRHVVDYRNARHAVEVFNRGSKGFEELNASPELQQTLLMMHRAQHGEGMTLDHVRRLMAAKPTDDDEGEG